jgi:hypothetical protein
MGSDRTDIDGLTDDGRAEPVMRPGSRRSRCRKVGYQSADDTD